MKQILLLLLPLIILSGCKNPECRFDSECELPIDYAVRSSCPFSAYCVEDVCKVGCPIYYHNYNPEISKSYPAECKKNSDCNCSSYMPQDMESCSCIKDKCVVLISQNRS